MKRKSRSNVEVDSCESECWNDAAEGWTDFVRTGKDYLRECLNNPATFDLIGNVQGKDVLDLACGEGYNTRLLASRGARVVGVDSSEILLNLARQEETKKPFGIKYYLRDSSRLSDIRSASFDLTTCFMALMDIKEYEVAVAEVARVLKRNGRFVFSIIHPCFNTMNVDGLEVDSSERYFDKVKETVVWKMERLAKKFTTVAFHRTLSNYSSALHKQHLLISRIVEPQATPEIVREYPVLKEELKHPRSVIFETVKVAC